MPVKRINYTGRKRIPASDIAIELDAADSDRKFHATVNLAAHGLPPDAEVYLEAYRLGEATTRFPFGTVASPGPQRGHPLALRAFAGLDGVLFRVKVVSPANRGKLLARADHVRPNAIEGAQDTLLPLLIDANLGAEVWRLEIDDPGGPVLLLNHRAPGGKQVADQPAFFALVYPTILRTVLGRIRSDAAEGALEEEGAWQADWLATASAYAGSAAPKTESGDAEWDAWVDAAAAGFARRHDLITAFAAAHGDAR